MLNRRSQGRRTDWNTTGKGMHRMELKKEGYWRQFENSGRIEDYLAFVSSGRNPGPQAGQEKEDKYAGIYMGDGNHIETVPGGRIR